MKGHDGIDGGVEVDGVEVEEDGVIVGVGRVSASCWTSAWKILTISASGSERNWSITSSVLGQVAQTFVQ